MMVAVIVFCIASLVIFYAMIGYPITLILLDRLLKPKPIKRIKGYEPTVTYMIVAHNEEKVILHKLENALKLDYPSDKLEILVTSDNSSDNTNALVQSFKNEHSERNIRLYVTKEHKGKTNAQNEGQKTVDSEILVMTDANSIFDRKAIRNLVECFSSKNIAYVCGKLIYGNSTQNLTSESESTYWNLDLKMRDIESRISTITAGNGAIYACRNSDYINFPPIQCHDSAMPLYYGMNGKKALFSTNAIAFEKAGEVNSDEFKRKVRMNRELIHEIITALPKINIFKYGWFSFFYFGHRTCRHLLGIAHLCAIVSSVYMALMGSTFWSILAIIQIFAFFWGIYQINHIIKNKPLRMLGYYSMTIIAQYVSFWKSFKGQQKAVWETASTTR